MAKQAGVILVTGTIGETTFYKLKGKYYARKKSSLSGKRVKNAPEFERTRAHSRMMAAASKTAAGIYRELSKGQREVRFYRRMVSEGLRLLKEGCPEGLLELRMRGDWPTG